jgi:thiamine monophosphate synthase
VARSSWRNACPRFVACVFQTTLPPPSQTLSLLIGFLLARSTQVSALRKSFPNKNIQVDGGVGPGNIRTCACAGANVIVAGSSIFNAKDSRGVITGMREVIDEEIKKAEA